MSGVSKSLFNPNTSTNNGKATVNHSRLSDVPSPLHSVFILIQATKNYTPPACDSLRPTHPAVDAVSHLAEFKSDIARPLDIAIATFTGIYPEGHNIYRKLDNVSDLLERVADHNRRHRLAVHQKLKVSQLIASARQVSERLRVPAGRLNDYNYLTL